MCVGGQGSQVPQRLLRIKLNWISRKTRAPGRPEGVVGESAVKALQYASSDMAVQPFSHTRHHFQGLEVGLGGVSMVARCHFIRAKHY